MGLSIRFGSVVDDDASSVDAALEVFERLGCFVDRVRLRDHSIEVELSGLVEIEKHRHVDAEVRIAVEAANRLLALDRDEHRVQRDDLGELPETDDANRATAARRSVGGYVSWYREMNAGFVAWGRGIRSGVRVPTLRQTDVAPTVARLMGLELGDVDGRPLIGAFR